MTSKGPRATARLHDWLDERNRALHARVAEKLRDDPTLVSKALANLDRWEQRSGTDRSLEEWRKILTCTPLSEVVALLAEDSETADRLRQSTPFAGVLTQKERAAILRVYDAL